MDKNNIDNMVQMDNSKEHALAEHISQMITRLEMGCAKVEQSAFDSINTTDRVMSGLKDSVELVQMIRQAQTEFHEAVKLATVSLEKKESMNLQNCMMKLMEQLGELEIDMHAVANAAMEANDAARCIEAGVVEQSEKVSEMNQYCELLAKGHWFN